MNQDIETNTEPEVCLAWATRKRHIAIDKKVLCERSAKTSGYSVSNGQYNTLSLSGLPDYPKPTDDTMHSHSDGYIEFKPLGQQKTRIMERSICTRCRKKYERILRKAGQFTPNKSNK